MSDLIDAHIAHLRAGAVPRNTFEDRRDVLRRLDRDLPLGVDQATVEELEEWLARPGWSAATRKIYYWHIREYFGWATDSNNPRLDWDPSASLRRPKVPAKLPNPCTTDQLAHALARAAEPWRTYVKLAAYAGLRCCEIASVRREDITAEWTTVVGKGGKTRMIPTNPIVWTAVADHPAGPIAGGSTAEYISHSGRYHLHRIGLPGVTYHRFRAWFATWLLRPEKLGGAGADVRTVQELLGHAQLNTTAIYTLVASEQRQLAVAALPALTPVTI